MLTSPSIVDRASSLRAVEHAPFRTRAARYAIVPVALSSRHPLLRVVGQCLERLGRRELLSDGSPLTAWPPATSASAATTTRQTKREVRHVARPDVDR